MSNKAEREKERERERRRIAMTSPDGGPLRSSALPGQYPPQLDYSPPSQNGTNQKLPIATEITDLIANMNNKIGDRQGRDAKEKKGNDALREGKDKLERELAAAKKARDLDIGQKNDQLEALKKELEAERKKTQVKEEECARLRKGVSDLQGRCENYEDVLRKAYELLREGDKLLDNWPS